MLKTITIRQALEKYPALLDEVVIFGSGDENSEAVTLQFYGNQNYRTKDLSLAPVKNPSTPTTEPSIKAEIHSDDWATKTDFDARIWFEQATEQEIIDLASIDYGGNSQADDVARFMEDHNEDVAEVFKYIELSRQGFEVHVDSTEALAWIKANWPNVALKIADQND